MRSPRHMASPTFDVIRIHAPYALGSNASGRASNTVWS